MGKGPEKIGGSGGPAETLAKDNGKTREGSGGLQIEWGRLGSEKVAKNKAVEKGNRHRRSLEAEKTLPQRREKGVNSRNLNKNKECPAPAQLDDTKWGHNPCAEGRGWMRGGIKERIGTVEGKSAD